MEQTKFELKQVKTINDLVELSIENPHDPILASIEESGNLAFVIKFLTGNYGLYSGLSQVISGVDYIRHEYHYNLDAFIVYELKCDSLEVVSISTYLDYEGTEPIAGIKYIISNKGSEPSVRSNPLNKYEALAYVEKFKEPEIDYGYWLNGKMNSNPLKMGKRRFITDTTF
jgi:hypothetical protein